MTSLKNYFSQSRRERRKTMPHNFPQPFLCVLCIPAAPLRSATSRKKPPITAPPSASPLTPKTPERISSSWRFQCLSEKPFVNLLPAYSIIATEGVLPSGRPVCETLVATLICAPPWNLTLPATSPIVRVWFPLSMVSSECGI